ncbi:zinc dependent phospholipase C family protein [Salidesulfovibrio onnuriiensis]|uniref:zinc dependent phospholipase C family protein n=1 Tax=Salidesulfovibrio onnuriiensis TaxID=2583823 RepID=UPI0011C8F65D|nr:zinc dependent phospholipase C family protein [Salidesulfovibrio onnuriiensis]
MPKELTHFLMAEKTAEDLALSRLGGAGRAQRHALLFGSVFPDILYYSARRLPDGIPGLPERMHGKQGGLDFLRMQADLLREQPENQTRAALLLGMICHVSLDETLHPLVGYFTESSPAPTTQQRSLITQRHRALESLIDMVLCPERIGSKKFSLKTIGGQDARRFLADLPLADMAREAATTVDTLTRAFASSWTSYRRLQRLCVSQLLARCAYGIGHLLPDAAREIIALLYAPQLRGQAGILGGTVQFRHPETGESVAAPLAKLMDKAVVRAAQLAGETEEYLKGGSFPAALPNPCAGLCGELRFFADPPVPRLFREDTL